MKKNEQRKRAEEAFLTDRGRITNRDLALQLGVHPATVARWKKKDEWDLKLLKTVGKSVEKDQPTESSREADLRHLTLLNARIDSYLKKKELLPSEILELAEAKFHIMGCMRMLEADMNEEWMETGDDIEHVFD
ncbi:MAG: terminase gpP N-terminus-related DNA-binding protein [Desulfomonilaceae bacterium]